VLPERPRRPVLAVLVAGGARALGATWRISRPDGDPAAAPGPAVLAGFHDEQLALLVAQRHTPFRVLVSLSRDGDLAADALSRLGVDVLRGSTSRGGVSALKAGARALRAGERVAVLVDGPRGPRHVAAPGVAALASLGRAPIVCLRATATPATRLRSWDRFAIPWVGARVVVRARVLPAPGRGRGQIEAARAAVEATLRGLQP
jgi:lysophospholipid acyltransferase (LPLAT)-like uncharacterized protein